MPFEVKSIDESTALEHYGVMGMKWGVRKDRKPQGYISKRRAKKNEAIRAKAVSRNTRLSKAYDSESKTKAEAGADLKAKGHKSKWAGTLGDYSDTYDNPKELDRILAGKGGIADAILKESKLDAGNAKVRANEAKRLSELKVSELKTRELKKEIARGEREVQRLLEYSSDYDLMYLDLPNKK